MQFKLVLISAVLAVVHLTNGAPVVDVPPPLLPVIRDAEAQQSTGGPAWRREAEAQQSTGGPAWRREAGRDI
ncbi:hypothetical protein BXZ70DRAFT_1012779 [Cristinia sonorae]|uniref:Secreted protein n=1 Tax=Cristinia sonorae TaxID=1940300 RepID=A0A8K0UEG6_9AGAR|nr:hypothetical protein BXZ70DRAFT_1012779 [Cristinia sonorae]